MLESPAVLTRGISVSYGGVHALDAVSFQVSPGSVLGIIGGNGSGKSSLLNVMSGLQRLNQGAVHLFGRDVTGATPWEVARLGVARTFQLPALPVSLSLKQAVGFLIDSPGPRMEGDACSRVFWRSLETFGLTDASILCGALQVPDRRLVSTLLALLSNARLVLLDEPFAGMDAQRIGALGTLVASTQRPNRTTLIVDHGIERLSDSVDHLLVLAAGRVVACGPKGSPEVQSAVSNLASHGAYGP